MRLIDRNSNDWTDRTLFRNLKKIYMSHWNLLFEMENLGDINKPLTPKILSNPNHKVTRRLLYIYSIESFIYSDLNRACRDKDSKQIQYYGPYAAALSYIIYGANKNRKDKLKGHTILYRGLKINRLELSKLSIGQIINLQGYTSTSKDFSIALKFAFTDIK